MTVDQFVTDKDLELDWIVPGRIPKPCMILVAGSAKAGKTFLMTDIGNRIAGGEEVFGLPARASRVLYITTDARAAIWRNFYMELQEHGVTFHPNFMLVASEFWHRPANVLSNETQQWTREILLEAKPDVVILDVLRDFHNGDENDSTSMKIVFDQLEKLFKDVAFIMVHHTKKIPEDVSEPNPQNYMRGSTYITGKVDDLWLLHNGILKMDGRMGGAAVKYVGQRLSSGFWAFPQAEEVKTKADLCVALCAEHPHLTHNQLVPIAEERLKLSRSTFFRYLKSRNCVHSNAPLTIVADQGNVLQTWEADSAVLADMWGDDGGQGGTSDLPLVFEELSSPEEPVLLLESACGEGPDGPDEGSGDCPADAGIRSSAGQGDAGHEGRATAHQYQPEPAQ